MGMTTGLAASVFRDGPGGNRALAELFERVMARIHRYFVKLVWDPLGVEDCMQQTMLRLTQSFRRGDYDPSRSFNRWMWLKAHSVYVDYCRRHSRHTHAPLEASAEPAAAVELARVDARLDAATVLARLRETLPAESFECFVLSHDEEMTQVEIASLLGRDRKTVRKRLREAEEVARRLLGEAP